MALDNMQSYELLEQKDLTDIKATGYLMKHKKTGAHVCLIQNDDENKVFSIGFRTPPEDSTGVPHILEHSVLCGSKKYPAKDPFIELAKGSLNTFLNAMTYPDKTVYPIASCNDKDFQNLMNVYLDAVFYPNIYERPEIFKQEGWHYELESIEDPIEINGVVYNEMKGAFSSPEDMLDREVFNTLFPDTAYSYESGGDPDVIPTLTYENFLKFHQTYYHPSNSYLYLYGNMDMEEKLDWIDQEYFSKYDYLKVDSAIQMQTPFKEPVIKEKEYSITNEESEEDNTYLAYNYVIDTSLNKELYLAFQIIEYALLLAPGAPLKQTLLDEKIGKDIMSTYENGILQPYFSIIAKNANQEDQARFMDVINRVLTEIVEHGFDEKSLLAGLNFYEFKYREADFGSYPKGLVYGLQAFDSWLYDPMQPFIHINAIETFDFLKKQVKSGYFEKLVQTYLIDNPHAALVIVSPKKGLTAELDRKLADKLALLKDSMSEDELKQMVTMTKALTAYQEEPSTKEEIESIPVLEIEDIKKEAQQLIMKEYKADDITVLHHDIFTSGIGYLQLIFDIDKIPFDLVPYVGILKNVLGYVNTKNYSYGELFNEINMHTGGIVCGTTLYSDINEPDTFYPKFDIRAKLLYPKLDFAFSMIEEILFTSQIEDDKRLYEIIAKIKSRKQMSMNSAGHSTAALRALSYLSKSAAYSEQLGGISYYRMIDQIESDFDNQKQTLKQNLKKLMHQIFRPENLMVDYTCETNALNPLLQYIPEFKQKLFCDEVKAEHVSVTLSKKNEGFKTSAKVQYVAMAGNFLEDALPYHGALKVLRVILGYDYLWNQVRVKGGAYGCMNSFSRVGECYFVSYRDPNLEKTLDTYQKAVDYVKNFSPDERDMKKYIIGTISNLDTPMNPSTKGQFALSAYLSKDTFENLQKERDEILSANKDDIQKLAKYVEALVNKNVICVLGGEEKIEEQKNLFGSVENLF
ncbi:MAG: insulinase family protein [Clostridia bacterium]|nr:insulinase family protein [Clostridia bacterium]